MPNRHEANRSVDKLSQSNRFVPEPITKGRFAEDRDAMSTIRDSAELALREKKTLMQQNIRLMQSIEIEDNKVAETLKRRRVIALKLEERLKAKMKQENKLFIRRHRQTIVNTFLKKPLDEKNQ